MIMLNECVQLWASGAAQALNVSPISHQNDARLHTAQFRQNFTALPPPPTYTSPPPCNSWS